MKSTALIIFIVLIFLPASADVLVGPFALNTGNWNIVSNGGFETGDTIGWGDQFSSKGVFRVSTEYVAVGSYSAKAIPGHTFTGSGFALGQSVSVTGGQQYVLSGFFNTSTVPNHSMYLDLRDVSFDVHVFGHYGLEEWQFAWKTFTVPSGWSSVTVRLVRDGWVYLGEYGYIDEVAITPIGDFVPPTACIRPTVGNVNVLQRNGESKWIDIHYDLLDEDSDTCTVSIEVSDNGGSTWTVPASSFTGDVGSGVIPGEGKHIIWDCKADLPGAVGSNYKMRIIADDGN